MSANMSEESFSDEDDDSYRKCIQKGNSIEQETVIDESGHNSNLSSSAISHDESSFLKDIQIKKKTVKPLCSDSDSDSDFDNDNTSGYKSKPQIDTQNGMDQIAGINESSSSDGTESLPLVNERSYIVDSASSDDSKSPILVIESSAETPKQNKVVGTDLQKTNDILNLTGKMTSSRISHQFQFNSEGILNSTAVHTTGQMQEKWRAGNVSDITESPDSSADQSVEIISDSIELSDEKIGSSPKFTPPFKQESFVNTRIKSPLQISSTRQQNTDSSKTPVLKQQPLISTSSSHQFPSGCQQNTDSSKTLVSKTHYEVQRSKVDNLEVNYIKMISIADNVNLDALPDKGQLIKDRLRIAESEYMKAKLTFENMIVSDELQDKGKYHVLGPVVNVDWDDIQAGANAVLPKTFGKQAVSTYNAQKAVTMDRLQQLHGALQTCPKEDEKEDDPKGLKLPLMSHQRSALAWLKFREKEKPSGGILADDMGLGKTLTMISLIVKSKELEKSDKEPNEVTKDRNQYVGKTTKFEGGSLIVCPASLINQWSGEIERRLKRGLISYIIYHGPKRESKPKQLAEYDVVITTYSIVNNENDKQSVLFKVRWRRIILDEAHQIRNYKAQTSEACCQLLGQSRWALTGTPMHNKEMDMYALLKFLRCTPFDELPVWKRWIGDKSKGGQERLHTIISSLMLRRTKVELIEKGSLNVLPEKQWSLIKVELDKSEMQVYHKVLIFSQTLFAQFLHQRAAKNQDYMDQKFGDQSAPNQEYFKMRQKILKLNKVKNVSQHEILVLLLRLRQICCHPSLITAMLDEGLEDVENDDEEYAELNLLEQLKQLNIDEHEDEYKPNAQKAIDTNENEKVNLKEATKGHLRRSDPIFAKERISSKIMETLKVLKTQVLKKDDKAVIVSQWSSYLNLVAMHLKESNVEFDQLDGKVPVNKRMQMVDRINDPKDSLKVLLLSLTAGGVGLNLVGANHLFLLDLHWNPQLERQAQDRIYRVGQTKPVFVYKFMALDTIEERIKMLQEKKLEMAESILTGTRQIEQNKLSIEDLRLIFQM